MDRAGGIIDFNDYGQADDIPLPDAPPPEELSPYDDCAGDRLAMLPDELKKLRQWLLWKFQPDPSGKKPRKVPHYVNGIQRNGTQGSAEDRTHLATFNDMLEALEAGRYSGQGVAMLPEAGLIGVDLDHCVVDGKVKPEYAGLIDGTYAEISPSGTGVRAFYFGTYDDRKHLEKGVEIFCGKGFLTITGNRINANPIIPLPDAVRAKFDAIFSTQRAKSSQSQTLNEAEATDPVFCRLKERGMVRKDCGSGKYWITCPNIGQHTSGDGEGDCCYYLPFTNGYSQGNFHCLHSHCSELSQAEFRRLIGIETAASAARFQFIHNADLVKNLKPISWRIADILMDKSFYYNFGDSGSYKTFIEIDRLLCIASGLSYHGHAVKQGTVFYIAGEGQQGIGRRIAAWHIVHGTKAADVPFFVAKVPTQLMDIGAVNDVRAAVDALSKEYGPPAVVHMDTLARNFGDGDENATKDMNRVIANMDLAFGNDFCRGLTHHTGHMNKDRARGSYALHAGADIAFRMEPIRAMDRILVECKKMKDAPPMPPMVFEKREIILQIGDERDTTFVMDFICEGDEAAEMIQPADFGPGKTGKGKNQGVALDELNRLYADQRKNLESTGYEPNSARVTIEDWRNACAQKGIKRNAFYKVKASLMGNGQIEMDKIYVYNNTI